MVTVNIDGTANTITVTPCNASGVQTGIPVVIPGSAIQDITAVIAKPQNFNYTYWTQFGNIVTPGQGMPNYIPFQEFYVARIWLKSPKKIMDLKLTEVYGQPTWTNDLAGATLAIEALEAAMPA